MKGKRHETVTEEEDSQEVSLPRAGFPINILAPPSELIDQPLDSIVSRSIGIYDE